MVTLNSEQRKARKDHVCDWCGQIIKAGVIYHRSANVYDGHAYTWKNHDECSKIANHLNMFDWVDEGLTADNFSEAVDAEFHDLMLVIHEDGDYKFPPFAERLLFVLNHHGIENASGIETAPKV